MFAQSLTSPDAFETLLVISEEQTKPSLRLDEVLMIELYALLMTLMTIVYTTHLGTTLASAVSQGWLLAQLLARGQSQSLGSA